ncbi:MAG: hypothetical protein JNL70_03310 [Saprospiraceae bacterium]|nr:hypothetical protein [Saprospiraceae bacterium]
MAFYHWKSLVNPVDLQQAKTDKLYVRLFDVDWNETTQFPEPLADVQRFSAFSKFKQVTPVVFLTNKTFEKLSESQLDRFVQQLFQKICRDTEGCYSEEIQFDCDWTETTRDRYFAFLQRIKGVFFEKKISATIRLHQIKFMEKTGVPPVDRGMLMAYNMGDLDNLKTENSILSVETLKQYVQKLGQYPVKLDVALPLFSWGVVFRDGAATKLLNNLSQNDILQTPQYDSCFQKIADNRFVLLKNQYLKGLYLYKNDEIRIEDAPLSILTETAQILSQNINNQELTVAFYHLDSATLQKYRYEDLEKIVQSFK